MEHPFSALHKQGKQARGVRTQEMLPGTSWRSGQATCCCLIKVLSVLICELMCFITLSVVGMQRTMAWAVLFVYQPWA